MVLIYKEGVIDMSSCTYLADDVLKSSRVSKKNEFFRIEYLQILLAVGEKYL